jgi:hypothetical protein
MKSNPIYIVENQVYRFEQVLYGRIIELFNSKLQRSVFMVTSDLEEIDIKIKSGLYWIIQY